MPESKTKTAQKRRPSRDRMQSGILSEFHCDSIVYDFSIPRKDFNVRAFRKETGIKEGERWNAGIYPKDKSTGYHIHFKGIIEKDSVHITVEYWDGAYSLKSDSSPVPYAETLMQWIGKLINETAARCFVMAYFQKPIANWRSRFNLPFKVTTSNDHELMIDGVSIVFPKNDQRAYSALVMRGDKALRANVAFARHVEFSAFDLSRELTDFNEAVNMFAERV